MIVVLLVVDVCGLACFGGCWWCWFVVVVVVVAAYCGWVTKNRPSVDRRLTELGAINDKHRQTRTITKN